MVPPSGFRKVADWCGPGEVPARTLGVSPAGQAGGDLLDDPAVAVRVTEGDERGVAAALGIRAGHPGLGAGVVEHPARVVEHLADLDAAAGQFGAGRLDVG